MARGRILHAITFTDDVTTTGSATQLYPLGTRREEETSLSVGGETYRYVLGDTGSHTVAAAAGALCYRGKTIGLPWKACTDIQDCASGLAFGVFQSVLVTAQYGWVKTKGYQSNLKKQSGTGLSWAKGNYLFSDPSTTASGKGKVIKIAATTKVSGAEIRAILQRNIGFAASTHSTTNTTGKAYIELE